MTNKEIVLQGFKYMNDHNLDGFKQLLSDDFVNHDMPMPEPGPEGFKQVLNVFLSAFPDFSMEAESIVCENDNVATRGYFTGTHKGEFMGIPATGKKIKVKYMDMWRFKDGKATENWVRMDNMEMMQQLGVVPSH